MRFRYFILSVFVLVSCDKAENTVQNQIDMIVGDYVGERRDTLRQSLYCSSGYTWDSVEIRLHIDTVRVENFADDSLRINSWKFKFSSSNHYEYLFVYQKGKVDFFSDSLVYYSFYGQSYPADGSGDCYRQNSSDLWIWGKKR